MLVRLITAPASEPVTVGEAVDHLRLETGLDVSTVTRLIATARRYVELVCWRGILTQQYEAALPSFAGDDRLELVGGGERRVAQNAPSGWSRLTGNYRYEPYLKLPKGQLAPLADLLAITPPLSPVPTSPVISVKYIDPNGAQQTLDPSFYSVDDFNVPGRLHLAPGATWPDTRAQWDAVKILYWVGWSLANVPEPIKQAILLLVSQLYEHRTPEVIARAIVQIQFTFDALVDPYRLNEIG